MRLMTRFPVSRRAVANAIGQAVTGSVDSILYSRMVSSESHFRISVAMPTFIVVDLLEVSPSEMEFI